MTAHLEDPLIEWARHTAPEVLAQAFQEARAEAVAVLRSRLTAALIREAERLPDLPRGLVDPQVRERAPSASGGDKDAEAFRPAVDGYYVYGLVRASADFATALDRGVDGAGVEMIPAPPLAAVVSRISTSDHDWGTDPHGEVDVESLAPRAIAHERVLEEVLQRTTVLPLRFGVMYPSRAAIEDLLRNHTPEIVQALERVDDHMEWGLTVTWDAPATRAPAHADSTGRDYLTHRREERAEAARLEALAAELGGIVHSSAVRIASDSVVHKAVDPSSVLAASYLVPNPRVEQFRQAIESTMVAAGDALGVSGQLTGPWPPYNFTDLRLEELSA